MAQTRCKYLPVSLASASMPPTVWAKNLRLTVCPPRVIEKLQGQHRGQALHLTSSFFAIIYRLVAKTPVKDGRGFIVGVNIVADIGLADFQISGLVTSRYSTWFQLSGLSTVSNFRLAARPGTPGWKSCSCPPCLQRLYRFEGPTHWHSKRYYFVLTLLVQS